MLSVFLFDELNHAERNGIFSMELSGIVLGPVSDGRRARAKRGRSGGSGVVLLGTSCRDR